MDKARLEMGSVPVRVAARVYGRDPAWVRAGIIAGWLPIGEATRNGKRVTDIQQMNSKLGRISYYISPKDEAQENEKQLKEDEAVRKVHELELDQEKAEKARKLDWAKIGMKALTFAGTIGMTVYWSICEAGGVTQLSRAIGEGVHELKRGFTEKD